MARITALAGFNMSLLNDVRFGEISPKGINAIAFDYGGGLMRVWGDYTFDRDDGLTGGTVSGLTYARPGGVVTAKVYGLGFGAVAFQTLAQASDGLTFYPVLLAGYDTITGSAFRDVLFGHDGNDQLLGGGGDDNLFGGAGDDALFGGAGRNVLAGGSGGDRLVGGGDADRLIGGTGIDSLTGGFGADVLIGGADNDALIGGRGADTFVFGEGGDRDVIYQFGSADRIALTDALWAGYATAAELVEDVGAIRNGNAVLDFGGTRIVLADVTDLAGLADQILHF